MADAAGRGDLGAVEALLAAGADVKGFGEWVPGCCQDRDTALYQAVRYWFICFARDFGHCTKRRTEVIQVLLAAGADVDARDKLVRSSALELADWFGFTEVMGILVRAGADPHAR